MIILNGALGEFVKYTKKEKLKTKLML
jgi:hypothetical protein